MSEYTEKRWRCDFCQRDVKRGVMPPAKWYEVRVDGYGNVVHCCDSEACGKALAVFCADNLIEVPT